MGPGRVWFERVLEGSWEVSGGVREGYRKGLGMVREGYRKGMIRSGLRGSWNGPVRV